MTETVQGGFKKFGKYFLKAVTFVSALNLFMMMALTAIAVISRYFFNQPIPGDTELVEFMMAIFVPLSVAICAAKHQHIAVDMFVEKMPKRPQAIFGIVSSLLIMAFYGLVAWENAGFLFEEAKTKTTTAVLLIPTYPFIAPLIIMGGVVVVVMLHQLIYVNIKGIFEK